MEDAPFELKCWCIALLEHLHALEKLTLLHLELGIPLARLDILHEREHQLQ